ncbi:hypothetical protein GR212_13020 [Rhizobium lusitanum]|uniref:Uncharacterized protein n=2 Tax=Rhizobium lusitanum TaxID=293958 RepID=A0A6L9U876_9HYPH|nr:hypothetical protein [Rhizobium lusitanum]
MPEFVQAFATSIERKSLLRNLIAYRALIATDGYERGYQFFDGSFVENVEVTRGRAPKDIDVFTMLHAPQKYLDSFALWQGPGFQFWSSEIADQKLNKERFSLDTYALLIEDAPLDRMLEQVMYWYSLFSHQRDTFAWKGFVAVSFDRAQDDEALALIEAM